jgi:hypothetical protein
MSQDTPKTITAMDRARRAMQRAGKPYTSQAVLEAIAKEIESASIEGAAGALADYRRLEVSYLKAEGFSQDD